jgi:hypothetical protein
MVLTHVKVADLYRPGRKPSLAFVIYRKAAIAFL